MPSDDLIHQIVFEYRLAKAAEMARIRIDQGLSSFARVFLTDWTPDGEEVTREAAKKQVARVLKGIRAGKPPAKGDERIHTTMEPMVLQMQPAFDGFEALRAEHEKRARKLASELPVWQRLGPLPGRKGFTEWGLAVLVGELGDLTDNLVPEADRNPGKRYSGCRRLFKMAGFAPDDSYERGEKNTGRMIPRRRKGRFVGIIADPILKHQWAAERGPGGEKLIKPDEKGKPGNIPAHATGPLGAVYGAVKARALAAGKTPGHAERLGVRAMIKALIHDVHHAWNDIPLDYLGDVALADAAD